MVSAAVMATAALAVAPSTAAAATPSPAAGQLQTATDDVLPSIVQVIQDAHGGIREKSDGSTHGPYDVTYSGTGFFVSADGYIVSAAHVAAPTSTEVHDELVDAYIDELYHCDPSTSSDGCVGVESDHHDEVAARTTDTAPRTEVHVQLQSMNPLDPGLPATVVTSVGSPSKDLAVLKVAVAHEPVAVVSPTPPAVGSPLAVIGYPQTDTAAEQTLVPTTTFGAVTEVLAPDPAGTIAADARLVRIDALVRQGNSGGPGVAIEGSVLGVVSFGDRDRDNYLVSGADVSALLASTPAANRLGDVDSAWRDGLRALAAHDTAAAAAAFHRCTTLNADVVQCRDRAAQADAALGRPAARAISSPVAAILVSVAALLALLVALVVWSRRRARRTGSEWPASSVSAPPPPPPPPPPPVP